MTLRIPASALFRSVLIAATLVLPRAATAEDKPAAAITTPTIEATVTIEKALKAYPGLYENLLAEGRREMARWRVQSEKDRKEMPDVFREGRRYAFERGYERRSAIGRYVSVVRSDYLNGLGAHPNHETNTILWDAKARKRVSIRPLFRETADNGPALQHLAKTIRATLAVEKKKRDVPVDDPDKDTWLASVKPSLLKIGAVALAPSTEAGKSSGLLFYFSPYAVGAYVEGGYTAFVPWTSFKDDLSAEGAGLFGGERPQGDDKNDSD
jgi:hypothetical protein